VSLVLLVSFCGPSTIASAQQKSRIKALAIPLADHYAGIVAYEKYRDVMQYADFQIQMLAGPHLVRSYFYSEADADIAFNVCPMVMDMFDEKPYFRWVSLIHRDGNCLCVNTVMGQKVQLDVDRKMRKPDAQIAGAIAAFIKETGNPVYIAIPSPLATHATVLYKYLKDHQKHLALNNDGTAHVLTQIVKPPKSPGFLKKSAARNLPAAFEQSLPWGEIAEINGFGKVGWYSKDVMQHPNGHVECIIIAKNMVIENKRRALQEVIQYIHRAGRDIERARRSGGKAMEAIIDSVRKHIPSHTPEAIRLSLRPDLGAISYKHLNIDDTAMNSIRRIMELAVEAGFLKRKINLDTLADKSFTTGMKWD